MPKKYDLMIIGKGDDRVFANGVTEKDATIVYETLQKYGVSVFNSLSKVQDDITTEIVIALDKSGSMNSIKNDTIGGFNDFIETQRKLDGEANVTLVLFNSLVNEVYTGRDLREVELLTDTTYQPSGGTALLDAIGIAIDSARSRNADKVILAIITDGEENSSVQYSKDHINKKISEMTEVHGWEFLFLGANLDAVKEAESLGIRSANAMNFEATTDGMTKSYVSLSRGVASYRTTGTVTQDWAELNADKIGKEGQ